MSRSSDVEIVDQVQVTPQHIYITTFSVQNHEPAEGKNSLEGVSGRPKLHRGIFVLSLVVQKRMGSSGPSDNRPNVGHEMIGKTQEMTQICDHTAALDHVPELWTEILKRKAT